MRRFALFAAPALTAALTAQNAPLPEPPPPPPLLGDHYEPTSALAREHQHHASVAGTIVDADGKPLAGATAVVLAYQPFYWALPLGRADTDGNGRFRIDELSGDGRTRLWIGSPPGTGLHAEEHPLTLVSGQHTELRPIALPKAEAAAAAPGTFTGKVLAGDGTPIAGALLRLFGGEGDFDPGCYTLTNADGSFSLPVRRGTPQHAQLLVGRCKLDIAHQAGVEQLRKEGNDWQLDLTGERTLQCDDLRLVTCRTDGQKGAELAWSLGGRWLPCVDGRAPTLQGQYGLIEVLVRATAPGHLPRAETTSGSTFAFADDVPMQLTVVDDAGAPLPDALVDICFDAPAQRFEEGLLQTLRTDAEGRLRLLGPKAASCVVYAYADGCEPARGRWCGGERLELRLPRRTARLHFELGDAESTLYVRRAGTFDLAAMRYPPAGPLDVAVAPGRYEVTRYHKGPAAGAASVEVAAGATAAVDLGVDQRPTITVSVPAMPGAGEWWAHCSRSAVGGMVSKRAIWTTRGGPMPRRELVAEVEQVDPHRFRLRLPTSGRCTVLVGNDKLDGRCFREGAVAFGRHYELQLPMPEANLKGSIAAWPESWGSDFSLDGIAGPRLWLEPLGSTPFGLLVALPAGKDFVLTAVPPGRFALQHHLYETGMFRSEDGTWGAPALDVPAGKTTDAGKLAKGPDAELQVRVRFAGGAPAGGLLAIRDRMSESWQQVVDENSTLVYASDPVPQPPSVRLVEGKATLGKVRAGRLLFALQSDDGGCWWFAREVDPAQPLEITLPDAAAATTDKAR